MESIEEYYHREQEQHRKLHVLHEQLALNSREQEFEQVESTPPGCAERNPTQVFLPGCRLAQPIPKSQRKRCDDHCDGDQVFWIERSKRLHDTRQHPPDMQKRICYGLVSQYLPIL